MKHFKRLPFDFDPLKLQDALAEVVKIVPFPVDIQENIPMRKPKPLNDQVILHQLCITRRNQESTPQSYYVWLGKSEGKDNVKINDNTKAYPNWEKDENHKEFEYNEVIPEFKQTYFNEVYETIQDWASKGDMITGRARLRQSYPNTCLDWHQDDQPNIHIPIITAKPNRLIIEDEMLHMQEGECWFANVMNRHTQYNASSIIRVHLVICVKHKDFKTQYDINKGKKYQYEG